MAAPTTYGDSLREHDAAIYDWLGTLQVDYGTIAGVVRNTQPILRVFASPQRAFATVTDVLVAQDWLPGADAQAMRDKGDQEWPNLPLPILTIDRDEPVADASQSQVPGEFRRVYLNPQTGCWEYHRHPGHFLTTYRVTLRCDKRYTDNFVREWLMAQLGRLGCTNRELLVPVTHRDPWGVQKHRLNFDGSVNLSALEGDDARMLSVEFSLTLRTWVFYPPRVGGDIVHGTLGDADLLADDSALTAYVGTGEATSNLFAIPVQPDDIPARWPVAGAATVEAATAAAPGTRPALVCHVSAAGDKVELAERLDVRDGDGCAIVAASFAYRATAAAALTASRHDLASGIIRQVFGLALPASPAAWQRVHVFTLVDAGAFVWDVAGAGAPADVTLADVDLRQVYDGARVPPGATAVVGSERVYQWSALEGEPYLVVGRVTPGQPAGTATVTAKDDIAAPDFQVARDVDRAAAAGFVFLVQPAGATLEVRVPATLGLDRVYAQRYHGPYNGHTV